MQSCAVSPAISRRASEPLHFYCLSSSNRIGPKNFIGQISRERAKGREASVEPARVEAGAPDGAPVGGAVRAGLPGVPQKISAKHGEAFGGAVADLTRIAE